MLTFDRLKIKIPAFIFILIISGIICRAEQVEIRYWFNQNSDNAGTVVYSSGTGSLNIPFQTEQAGRMNVLNIQVKNAAGLWSVPYRYQFLPPTDGKLNLAYGIDTGEINDLDDNNIDVSGVYSGVHQLYVIDKNMTIPPSTALIYKNSAGRQNLKLILSSIKNSVNKAMVISDSDSECLLDVSTMTPGIYPVNVTIADTVARSLVAMVNTNVEITAPSGNRLTDIYYWLNDSIDDLRRLELKDAKLPIAGNVDLALADLNIPSLDYHLSLDDDGQPFIAPTYDITLSFRNNYGFAVDSTSLITDNSKRVELHATQLSGSSQYDTDKWITDSCYWYQFNAIEGDNVSLSTRLRCKVKLYSPSTELVDTAIFNFKKLEIRKRLEETGTYYVQLSEIDQSRQEFSVLLTYLSGPSVNNHNQPEPTYEGIPIEWQKASDWVNGDNLISYTTKGVKMTVDGSDGRYQPYVADNSRLCRVYTGNTIWFSSGGDYIEQITLCLPNIPDYEFPRITTPSGTVSVDTMANIVVWTGFSRIAEIKVDANSDDVVLPLTKAYVKVSDLTENDIYLPDDNEYAGVDYTPYNIVRLWRQGEDEQEDSYAIESDTKITFENNELVIATGGKVYRHSMANKIILTFDYDSYVGLDETVVPDNYACVTINGDNIHVSGLPGMVGIYSPNGLTYYQDYVEDNELVYPISKLQPGIYIIVAGEKSIKILIP